MNEGGSLLPLTSSERLRRLHDVVTRVLWRTGEDLTLVVLEHTAVGLADDALLDIRRRAGLSKERNLEKHAAREVDALKKFEVNVEMEWELSLSLKALLFRRHLGVSLNHNALSEKLLLTSTATDLLKCVLGLVDKSRAESTETDLNKSPVEQNLAVDVEVADSFLQMRHEHHVASLVVIVVKSEEVDLAKHSTGTDDAFAVEEKVIAENADESGRITDLSMWGDCGLECRGNSSPALLLEDLDNSGRLDNTLATVLPVSKMVKHTLKYACSNLRITTRLRLS